MKTLSWYRLDPAKCLGSIHGLSNAEAGKWCRQFFVDLIMGDKACSDPMASAMIREREAFSESKRKAGEKGAAATWQSRGSAMAEPLANDGRALAITERNGTERNIKTEIFRTEEFSGDKYEKIQSMSDDGLPGFCSRYCDEGDPAKATGAFRKQMRRIGVEAFRSILLAFVGECESGEEPRNRGSALMARMKKADALRKIAQEVGNPECN